MKKSCSLFGVIVVLFASFISFSIAGSTIRVADKNELAEAIKAEHVSGETLTLASRYGVIDWETIDGAELLGRVESLTPEQFAVVLKSASHYFRKTDSGLHNSIAMFDLVDVDGEWTSNAARTVAAEAPFLDMAVTAIESYKGKWRSRYSIYTVFRYSSDWEIQLAALKKCSYIHAYGFNGLMGLAISYKAYQVAWQIVAKTHYWNNWVTGTYFAAIAGNENLSIEQQIKLQRMVVDIACTHGETVLDPIQAAIWKNLVLPEVGGTVSYYAEKAGSQAIHPEQLSIKERVIGRINKGEEYEDYFLLNVPYYWDHQIQVIGDPNDNWVGPGNKWDGQSVSLLVKLAPETRQDPRYWGTFELIAAAERKEEIENYIAAQQKE